MSHTPDQKIAEIALYLEDIRRTADQCVKCNICTRPARSCRVTDCSPAPSTSGRRRSASAILASAVARPIAGLLLGLRRLHAGLPARRQRDGDQHAGQGRAAEPAVSREPAEPARGGAIPHSATTRCWARSAAWWRPWRTQLMRFRPVRMPAWRRPLGIDHRAPSRPSTSRTFRRWFYGEHRSEMARRRSATPQVTYFHGCAGRNTTNWWSARRSSRCWSTTASR